MAGLWCTSLGFSETRLKAAAAAAYDKFGFYHSFNHKTPDNTIDLAEKLVEISRIPDAQAYFATSGSEATETMVKLAWVYHAVHGKPGKRKIIARDRGFHGSTIVAASMCGLPRMHREFGLPLDGFLHTHCPRQWRPLHVSRRQRLLLEGGAACDWHLGFRITTRRGRHPPLGNAARRELSRL
ncbi:adenosylmethionine-8-amino-7-oxononanoate aminotransferase [Bradyrhizobium betae]|nr:aminotransferase class III-fold pyridoxal phosphate-dependent enzyme [Bradyrhizobium betae]MCS3725419.1 adenosylmethionine-8-amino-7-oxononanoate aminotransferase [Bradyrhizobium betae]